MPRAHDRAARPFAQPLLASLTLLLASAPLLSQDGSHARAQAVAVSFEVSSIRQNTSDGGSESFGFVPGGDRFRASDAYLVQLIQMAYGIQNTNPFDAPRVAGLPGWASSNRYDIEATVAPADVAKLHSLNAEQRMLLLKPLLFDRLKLQAHFENRQQQGFDLIVLQSKPKAATALAFRPAEPQQGAGAPVAGLRVTQGDVTGRAVNIATLARFLQTQVAHPVVDRTGLQGIYDLHLSYAPRLEDREPDPTAGPSIFTAVQEQLGLKLVPAKEMVPILVIDHIEKPAEN